MRLSRLTLLSVAQDAGGLAPVDAVQDPPATKDLPTGSIVGSDAIERQDGLRTAASGNSIRTRSPDRRKQVVGAPGRSTFHAGEPIGEAKPIRTDRGVWSAILLAAGAAQPASARSGYSTEPNAMVAERGGSR